MLRPDEQLSLAHAGYSPQAQATLKTSFGNRPVLLTKAGYSSTASTAVEATIGILGYTFPATDLLNGIIIRAWACGQYKNGTAGAQTVLWQTAVSGPTTPVVVNTSYSQAVQAVGMAWTCEAHWFLSQEQTQAGNQPTIGSVIRVTAGDDSQHNVNRNVSNSVANQPFSIRKTLDTGFNLAGSYTFSVQFILVAGVGQTFQVQAGYMEAL